MQLLLSFVPELTKQTEPDQNVWQTLDDAQRRETLAALARLLAKTAAASAEADSARRRREREEGDD